MNLFISISIWLLFIYFESIKIKWWLDSITFQLLWLRQLPTVDISFIWIILKKLLIFPEFLSQHLWLYNFINNYIKISQQNYINIIIFLFYFLFTYFTIIISKRFYWKDVLIVKLILLTILLTIVYFY